MGELPDSQTKYFITDCKVSNLDLKGQIDRQTDRLKEPNQPHNKDERNRETDCLTGAGRQLFERGSGSLFVGIMVEGPCLNRWPERTF